MRDHGVNVIGWVDRATIFSMLKSCDCYVSASDWEGMPVSIIEAFMCNIPVVAHHCAGNIDVIEHGNTGFIYNDSAQACSYIRSLLNDNKLYTPDS